MSPATRMAIGLTTAILHDLTLKDVAKFAAEVGIKKLEAMCWPPESGDGRKYAGITHIDVTQDVSWVLDTLAEYGVELSGLGYYPNPLCEDEAEADVYIQHLLKVIDAAEKLGVPVVNTFIGRQQDATEDESWEMFEKRWPRIVHHAEAKGRKIGIENCPMLFTWDEMPYGKNLGSSPDRWRRMFEMIESDNFGLNLDPAHLALLEIDPVPLVHEFKKKLFHTHGKDVKLNRAMLQRLGRFGVAPLDYHSPVLPGKGDVPWDGYIAALKEVGYTGVVSIEVEDKEEERGGLDGRKQAIRKSFNFLAPRLV